MARTRLKYLILDRFRSFGEKTRIDLPDNGMVLFKGPSGVGKSTIAHGITYALDFCPYPATELQSWHSEDPPQVELGFETDQTSVVVQRGVRNSIKIGDKTTTGAKAIQERLRDSTGLSSEMLEALTYRQQGQPGRFLSKTNSEKQEFLAQLLDLGKFEAAIEVAQKRLAELQPKLVSSEYTVQSLALAAPTAPADTGVVSTEDLEARLVALEAELEAQKLAKETSGAELARAQKEVAGVESEIKQSYKASIQAAMEKVNSIPVPTASPLDLTPYEQAESEVRSYLSELEAEDKSRSQSIQDQRAIVQRSIWGAQGQVSRVKEQQTQANDLRRQIRDLEANRCPTCSQAWVVESQRLESLRQNLSSIESIIEQGTSAAAEIPQLTLTLEMLVFAPSSEIPAIRAILDQKSQELAAARESVKSAKALADAEFRLARGQALAEVTKVEQERDNAVATFRNQAEEVILNLSLALDTIDRRYFKLSYEIQSLRHEIQTTLLRNQHVEEKLKAYQDQVRKHVEQVTAAETQANELRLAIAAEKDFIQLVGREGFLGAIFDEVLQEISAETNSILGRVANTAHVTLQFVSEVENKKGSTRREIRPLVSIGGHVASVESGCSGGMKTAVHLATDIAVRKVISRRTGSYPAFLILDESFDGLDQPSKEACFELLAQVAQDELILVVDHAQEFQQLFTKIIELEFCNGITSIKESK